MTKTKKIIVEFLIFLPVLLLVISLGALNHAYAQGAIDVPAGLCGEGGFPCPQGDDSVKMAQSLMEKIGYNIRVIIGSIAIILIIVSGIKMITAGGNEEIFNKQRSALFFGILGLFFVALAGELAQIFEVGRGGFLKDPNVMLQKSRLFNRTVEIIITLIKYLISSIAVVFIVRNGLRLVLLGGNEEEVAKDRKNIFYAILGLIVILISNPIVNKIFFKIDTSTFPGIDPVRPAIDPMRLIQEITGMTNVIAAIAGPLAMLSLLAGGIMYILGGADEQKLEKAKKIITWSLIGLVIIYGAFAIVSTFVARKFEGL